MKTFEGAVFQKSWNQKLCKVHRMTPNQTQGIGHQVTLHMCTMVPRVPNFRPLRSTISGF